MKKVILIGLISLTFASIAFADRDRFERREEFERRPHPDARWHNEAGWLVPAIIGGALVYGAVNTQPRPSVIVQQQQYYPIEPGQQQLPPRWLSLGANRRCQLQLLSRGADQKLKCHFE